MIKVGLTGGIGSGKSTVAAFWRLLGIPVYDSDSRARDIMNSEQSVISAVTSLLGNNAYNSQGLDRAYVASQVFDNQELLTQLNAIVHPAVEQDFLSWSEYQTSPYVIEESAILFESKAARLMDFTVVVTASQECRIARTMARNNLSAEQVLHRIKSQTPQERLIELCDFVIDNQNGPIIPQIISIDRIIRDKICFAL